MQEAPKSYSIIVAFGGRMTIALPLHLSSLRDATACRSAAPNGLSLPTPMSAPRGHCQGLSSEREIAGELRGSKPTPFAIFLSNLNGNMVMFTPALTRFSLSLSRIVAESHRCSAPKREARANSERMSSYTVHGTDCATIMRRGRLETNEFLRSTRSAPRSDGPPRSTAPVCPACCAEACSPAGGSRSPWQGLR